MNCLILLVLFDLIHFFYAYHLSLNELPSINANNYCYKHCKSGLISIHNDKDFINMLQQIDNNINYMFDYTGIYIGLYRYNTESEWIWIDNTTFSYPLKVNINNKHQNCVIFDVDLLQFISANCSIPHYFLCNSCDGILTKYISKNLNRNFSDAQIFCKNKYNTSLASIHSNNDMVEAQLIGNEIDKLRIWIGLYDKNMNKNYTWTDETTLDFGSNVNGTYPWAPNEPDHNGATSCVYLKHGYYYWKDNNCKQSRRFLCNIPSETCHSNKWKQILNPSTSWYRDTKNCEVIDNAAALRSQPVTLLTIDTALVIHDKQWKNDLDSPLVIEYLYSISSPDDSGSLISHSGIVLYDNQNYTNGYYFGISPSSTLFANIFYFWYWENNNVTALHYQYLPFNIIDNVFYKLRIERWNGTKFKISVNDKYSINITHDSHAINKTLSGYVGIADLATTTHAKSLHVSGEIVYNEPIDLSNYGVYYGIQIIVSFEYTLVNNSVSTNIILNALTNATLTVINLDIEDCVDHDDYNISVVLLNNSSIITATVFVCDLQTQILLITQFENNLDSDFITEIDKITILSVDDSTVNIQMDEINVIHFENENDDEIFKSTLYVNNITQESNDIINGDDSIINTIIITVVIGVVIIVVIIIAVIFYFKSKDIQQNDIQMIPTKSMNSSEIIVDTGTRDTKGFDDNSNSTDDMYDNDEMYDNEEGTKGPNGPTPRTPRTPKTATPPTTPPQ